MTSLEQMITSSHRLRPHTKAQYVRHVRSFVEFTGGDPRHWTGAAVEAYRDKMLSAGAEPGYVNTKLSAIKKASERWSALGHGPDFAKAAELLPLVSEKTREALPFNKAQDFIAACEGTAPIDMRDMAMMIMMARTGIRREGLISVNFEDINGREIVVTLKGGKRHKFLMDVETREALATWMGWLKRHGVKSGRVFRSIRSKVESDGVVGEGLTVTGLHAIIKRRGARARMPSVHAHLFRHSFITWMRSLEVPDWQIALITGHKILTAPGIPVVPQLGTYTSHIGDPIGDKLPRLRRE